MNLNDPKCHRQTRNIYFHLTALKFAIYYWNFSIHKYNWYLMVHNCSSHNAFITLLYIYEYICAYDVMGEKRKRKMLNNLLSELGDLHRSESLWLPSGLSLEFWFEELRLGDLSCLWWGSELPNKWVQFG